MIYLIRDNVKIEMMRKDNKINLAIHNSKNDDYASVDLTLVEAFNLSKILFNFIGSEHSELPTKEDTKIARQAFSDWLNTDYKGYWNWEVVRLLKDKFKQSDFYKIYLSFKTFSGSEVALGAIRIALMPYLPKDHFISDALIKSNIGYFFNIPFDKFARDFIAEVEKEKVEFLNNQKRVRNEKLHNFSMANS